MAFPKDSEWRENGQTKETKQFINDLSRMKVFYLKSHALYLETGIIGQQVFTKKKALIISVDVLDY
jgi:hypothetical protein